VETSPTLKIMIVLNNEKKTLNTTTSKV